MENTNYRALCYFIFHILLLLFVLPLTAIPLTLVYDLNEISYSFTDCSLWSIPIQGYFWNIYFYTSGRTRCIGERPIARTLPTQRNAPGGWVWIFESAIPVFKTICVLGCAVTLKFHIHAVKCTPHFILLRNTVSVVGLHIFRATNC